MFVLEDVQDAVTREVLRDLGNKPAETLKSIAYSGLAEEAGEVCGIRKRELRDYEKDKPKYCKEHKIEEIGDVLWYLAMVCMVENIRLEEVWNYNRAKLEERYGHKG